MRLMQHLLPQLEQFCTAGNVNDENIVVDFLKTTTMVGLLPVRPKTSLSYDLALLNTSFSSTPLSPQHLFLLNTSFSSSVLLLALVLETRCYGAVPRATLLALLPSLIRLKKYD